jgi:Cof subfamily protein (haloacid dehalogenase superfamily)
VVVKQFLFGIDLDGTLLDPISAVTDRTKAAVHAILKAGHLVIFATGRNWIEARPVFEAMAHHDLVVLVSGAVVVDARTGKSLYRTTMTGSLAAELSAVIERCGHAAVVLQDRHHTGFDYLVSADRAVHPALDSWMQLSDQRVERRLEIAKQDHSHTLRVSTVLDFKAAADLKAVLDEEFHGRAYVHGLPVPTEGVEIIEMFDPDVDKWSGLKQAAAHYKMPAEQIIAIGDAQNDLPMLRQAKLGIAMGNAASEVKEVADRIIGSNAEDGLAKFLEEWLRESELAKAG